MFPITDDQTLIYSQMFNLLIDALLIKRQLLKSLLNTQICFVVLQMCWPWKLTEPVGPMTQTVSELVIQSGAWNLIQEIYL